MSMKSTTGPPRVRAPRNLNRATACSHCRRRKTKCDQKKPCCSQCLARSKPGHELVCEYPEVSRSRKQTLEASISTLEKRIRELERSEPDEDSIQLYEPSNFRSTSSSSFYKSEDGSPKSSGSSLFDSIDPIPGSSLFASAFDEEIPPALGQKLIQAFIPHAYSFGFFLNIDRFVSSTTLPLSLGDHSRPCASLLCAIYLIGLHLSGANEDEESVFLSRALLHVSNVLSASHPLRLIHGTQAEILLCTYFFRTGRILEGKYHLSAAVSLATCAGLHQLRSASGGGSLFTMNLMGIGGPTLPEPKDLIDEGERINAFWTAFTLCNCWGFAVGGFSSMMFESHGSRIDTPWPLDMEDYEQNRVPVSYIGDSTVRNFLSRDPLSVDGKSSRTAMFAQSSLLLDRAAYLASLFVNELHQDEHTRYMKTFLSLDALIDSLHSFLPSLFPTSISRPDFMITWAMHLICRVATIKLHTVFMASSSFSRKKALEAAEGIVSLVRGQDLSGVEVNPVFGILWKIAGQTITEEIMRLDRDRQALMYKLPSWDATPAGEGLNRRQELLTELEELFLLMEVFSGRSKIIEYELSVLQGNYRAIAGPTSY